MHTRRRKLYSGPASVRGALSCAHVLSFFVAPCPYEAKRVQLEIPYRADTEPSCPRETGEATSTLLH